MRFFTWTFAFVYSIAFLVFVLALFPVQTASGQTPAFRHFSTDDGMPSNEVYDVITDNRGYVWIATNLGVARYDGYGFESFTLDDGLLDNTIFDITEDSKGNLWFTSYSGLVSFYDGNKIVPYRYNEKLLDFVPSKYSDPRFYPDEHGGLYYSILQVGEIYIDSLGTVTINPLRKKHKVKPSFLRSYYQVAPKALMRTVYEIPDSLYGKKDYDQHIILDDGIIEERVSFSGGGIEPYCFLRDGSLILAGDNWIYHIKDGGLLRKGLLPGFQGETSRINRIFEDNEGRLWFTVKKEGVFVFDHFDFENPPSQKLLNGENPIGITQDDENGIWITTYDNGLFYFPDRNIWNYSFSKAIAGEHITAIQSVTSGVAVGYANGTIALVQNNATKTIVEGSQFDQPDPYIHDLDFYNNRLWVAVNKNTYYINEALDPVAIWHKSTRKFYQTKTGRLLLCGNQLFEVLQDTVLPTVNKPFRYSAIAETPSGDYWVGNHKGLWRQSTSDDYATTQVLEGHVTALEQWGASGDTLLVATRGQGLIIRAGEKIIPIGKNEGLASNNLSAIAVDESERTIWLGTNMGVQRIRLTSLHPLEYGVEIFHKGDGLTSRFITCLELIDSNLWVGTNHGLSLIDTYQPVVERPAPPVLITKIEINQRDTSFAKIFELPHWKNNILLEFTGISMTSSGNLTYRYRMAGINESWTTTEERTLQYNLTPGDYLFEVLAIDQNGISSTQPAQVRFTILPPFWTRWWFISIGLVLGFLAVVLLIRKREAVLKEKASKELQFKQQLIGLELKALRAQMNPHFTFNTLNSIQHYIWEKSPKSASVFLAKFARLIRKILELSEDSVIPLADEMEVLTSYLELEQMRLEDKLNFSIRISPQLNANELYIPNTILQPFVENAIWHGIHPKSGMGEVVVSIEPGEQGVLRCTIKDDGIGRIASGKLNKRKNHNSLGMTITNERISLLEQIYKVKLKVEIIDLLHPDGSPAGTQVEIDIPLFDG